MKLLLRQSSVRIGILAMRPVDDRRPLIFAYMKDWGGGGTESTVLGLGGRSSGGVGWRAFSDEDFGAFSEESGRAILSSIFVCGELGKGIWGSSDRNLTSCGQRAGGSLTEQGV